MSMRRKSIKEENFPVGMLVKKELRPLVLAYYEFARYCDDIADDPMRLKEQKLADLDEAEGVLLGTRDAGEKLEFIKKLRELFVAENLSFSLLSELLSAFRQDSEGFEYQTWSQLTDYCQRSAVPAGRFMLALHDETPSTYFPAAALCTALQVLDQLQDIKFDAAVLGRVYLPEEWLEAYGVGKEELKGDASSKGLKKLVSHALDKVRGLMKDSLALPSLISSTRLRCEVCVIISLTNIMIKRIGRGDVLTKRIRLSKIDWLQALTAGVTKGLFMKRRISQNQRL